MNDKNYTELLRAMQKLNRRVFRAMHRSMHESPGLYRGQRAALALLREHEGASQRELAEWLDVRPSSVTELIGKLESKGFVRRQQDEADQRVMRIYLTLEGEKALAGASDEDAIASIFSALTEEETAQLLALIEKLNAGMEETEADYPEFPFQRGGGRRRGGPRSRGNQFAPEHRFACDRNCLVCRRLFCEVKGRA